MHRIFIDEALNGETGELVIAGDEAAHAVLVKRLNASDRIEVLDGRGAVAQGEVLETSRVKREPFLRVRLTSVGRVAPVSPAVHVCSAVPKGDRAGQLIDQLAQVGAASWSALETEHGVAEAGGHKLDRFARIAREASKQSGRAWMLNIEAPCRLSDAARATGGVRVLVADATGQRASDLGIGAGPIRLLVGPEGGWSSRERDAFVKAGVGVICAGPHVMRIETAAVAAAVAILNAARV